MTNATTTPSRASSLRAQAVSRLAADSGAGISAASPVAALQALYQLASSAETAPRALALLHELQVHQVELDLQDDELRRSRVELEVTLRRQTVLYDSAPVGYFTVDDDTAIYELNLTGARLVGIDRDALGGRTLAEFLTTKSLADLKAAFAKLGSGMTRVACDCVLRRAAAASVAANASIVADPDGRLYLVALSADPE